MFSLIITIISIALVAALAIATIYYGGDAFTKGKTNADVARFLNEASQIQGASKLYENEHGGTKPASIQVLIDEKYLNGAVPGWSIPDAASPAELTVGNADACSRFNEKYGISGVPACTDAVVTSAKQPICCSQ